MELQVEGENSRSDFQPCRQAPPRRVLGVDDQKGAPGAAQEVSHGQCRLAAADNGDIHFGAGRRHGQASGF